MSTESHEQPSVRRWQDQFEIPVRVTSAQVTDQDGSARTIWAYDRLLVPALTAIDVNSAVDRDFDADADVRAQALAAMHAALAVAP